MSDSATNVWNNILAGAMMLPGAKINRADFLKTALGPFASESVVRAAIETTPAKAGVSDADVAAAAQSSINWHKSGVSASAGILGLPGGWWMAGTIPADLTQYFWHTIVVIQKLAYLHGWPALFQDDEEIDDETKLILTLFVGVMVGAQGATEAITKLSAALSKEVVKRIPRMALTKYALYNIAKEVAKWIGISLTKKKLAEFLGKVVPVLGGAVAAAITWVTFGAGTSRLQVHLAGLPQARP